MKDQNLQLELKKQELLFSITKEELADISDRFDKVEEKAARHFTVLSFVLGLAILGLDDFAKIVLLPCSLFRTIFLCSYILLVFFTLVTMIYHLLILKFSDLHQMTINQQFIKQLDDISYSTAIYKISSQNTEFINKNQKILIKKIEYAKTAYLLTFFVIGFATTSSVLFLLYKVIL